MAVFGSPLSSLADSFQPPDDTPNFVNLDDRYKCAVCRNILKNPVQTKCGHRLCENCLDELFKNGEPAVCPEADEFCEKLTRKDIYPDVSARREIQSLPVYCSYKNNGCDVTVPWKQLNKHLEQCQFKLVECPNKERGCLQVLKQQDLKTHAEQCNFRLVNCKLCKLALPYVLLEKHRESDCPEETVSCPYNCGAQRMKRKEMDLHTATCKKKPRECKFKGVGCSFVGSEREVEEHEKRDVPQHMELITIYTGNMDLQNMDIRHKLNEMTTERDTLLGKLEQSHKENEGLKAKVVKLEDSIKNLRLKMVDQTERIIKLERRVEEFPTRDKMEQQNRELTSLSERCQTISNQIAGMEGGQAVGRYGSIATMADAFTTQLSAHDRQVGIHDVRIAEMDLRFQILETASYDGVLLWKIRDYTRRKQEAVSGRTLSLYSQPFYTSRFGYKMCARCYLNGDGMGKTTHVSLFFVIMRGEYDALQAWPFQCKVTLYLLDQGPERRNLSDHFFPDPTSSSFRKPQTDMNVASGCPLFVSHAVLENPTNNYLKDDTLFIKIHVDTTNCRSV